MLDLYQASPRLRVVPAKDRTLRSIPIADDYSVGLAVGSFEINKDFYISLVDIVQDAWLGLRTMTMKDIKYRNKQGYWA